MIPQFIKNYAARGALTGTLLLSTLFGYGCEDSKRGGNPDNLIGLEDTVDAGTQPEGTPIGPGTRPTPYDAGEGEGEDVTIYTPVDAGIPEREADAGDDPFIHDFGRDAGEDPDARYDGGEGEGAHEDDPEVPIDLPEDGRPRGLDKAPECRRLAGGYNFASELTMELLLSHAHNGGEGLTVVIPDRDLENDSEEIDTIYDYLREVMEELGYTLGDVAIDANAMSRGVNFYIPLEKIVAFDQEEYRIKVLEHNTENDRDNNERDGMRRLIRHLRIEINGEEFAYEFVTEYDENSTSDGQFHEILANEDSPEDSLHAFFGRHNHNAVFESLRMMLAKKRFVDTKMTVRIPQDNESREYTLQSPDGEDISFKLRVQDDIENWGGNGVDVFMGRADQEDWQQEERDLYTGNFNQTGYGFGVVLTGVEIEREIDEEGRIQETRYAVLDLYATEGEGHETIPLDFAPRRRHERPGDECPAHTFLVYLGFNEPTINENADPVIDDEGNEITQYHAASMQTGGVRVAAQKTLRPLTSIRSEELPGIANGVLDHRRSFLDTSTVVYVDGEGQQHAYPQIVIGGRPYEARGEEGDGNQREEERNAIFNEGPGRALNLLFLQMGDLVDN
jgi:hypothetical protein